MQPGEGGDQATFLRMLTWSLEEWVGNVPEGSVRDTQQNSDTGAQGRSECGGSRAGWARRTGSLCQTPVSPQAAPGCFCHRRFRHLPS